MRPLDDGDETRALATLRSIERAITRMPQIPGATPSIDAPATILRDLYIAIRDAHPEGPVTPITKLALDNSLPMHTVRLRWGPAWSHLLRLDDPNAIPEEEGR